MSATPPGRLTTSGTVTAHSGALAPKRRLTRSGGFLAHLGVSIAIFAGLLYVIAFRWYPGPYFAYDGGLRGTIIVIAVGFVLGPTLTLIVLGPRKPISKIRFDLCVIALVQVTALAWGVRVVEAQRPVAIAYFNGAFNPVTAKVLRDQGASVDAALALGPERPPLVYAALPADGEVLDRVRRMHRKFGVAPYNHPDLHEPLAPNLSQVAARQEDVAWLAGPRPHFDAELRAFLDSRGARLEDYIYVPFNGRYGRVIFVLDKEARLTGVLERAYEGLL